MGSILRPILTHIDVKLHGNDAQFYKLCKYLEEELT